MSSDVRIAPMLEFVGEVFREVERASIEGQLPDIDAKIKAIDEECRARLREQPPESRLIDLIPGAVGDARYIASGVHAFARELFDPVTAKRVTTESLQPLILGSLSDPMLRKIQYAIQPPIGNRGSKSILPATQLVLVNGLVELNQDLTLEIDATASLCKGCPAKGKIMEAFYQSYVNLVF